MKSLKVLLGGWVVLTATMGNSPAPEDRDTVSSWYIPAGGTPLLDQVAERFEIHHKLDNGYEVYVPAFRTDEFLNMVPGAKLLQQDISRDLRVMEKIDPGYLAAYHSWAEVQQLMNDFASRFPEIARLETYGQSRSGKPLLALKVSDNPGENESEPELLLTAATHGDEIITTEVLLTLMTELLEGYGKDARLTAMVENHELWFIPVVNPDGFSTRSRYDNGTDPNRDYPWPEQPTRNSVPSVTGVINFFHANDFAGSIDFHAYGRLIMYPWAYTSSPVDSSDELAFRNLGNAMAANNRYDVGQISRIIYVAKGSSADYYHWKKGSISYGIELTTSKAPPSVQIPSVVTEAREMTWKFIENF